MAGRGISMYKICKTEQSANRQRELEMGLLNLMTERAYEDISISDLCLRLNIPRKAFYRYFSCKEGALQALIDHSLMEFNVIVEDRMDLTEFFNFWRSQKPLLDAISKNNLQNVFYSRIIESALREEHITSSAKVCKMNFILFGLMSMVLSWYQTGYRDSTKEMARIAKQVLTTPLITDNVISEI